jgi:hypothetical protein
VTRALGPELPDSLLGVLATDDIAAFEGLTFLLLTVREDGWPHVAMLSVGELVALDATELRLALWPGSTATANLARSGKATLAAVLEETSYTTHISAERVGNLETPLAGALARFHARVEQASADVAPYAVLESGVRFRLTDPQETLARWSEVRSALKGSDDR